jgi:ferredoxin-NADP reductase
VSTEWEATVSTLAPARGLRRLLDSPVLAALTTPHGVDRYLDLVNPMWSVREVRARVVGVHQETPDVATVTLRPNGNWPGFVAGQYVQVGIEVDGARRTRCFSLSGSAHRPDGLLTLTVKQHPTGHVARFLRTTARPGTVVTLSPPDGTFTLPARRPDRLLLISGGSGITPVMSMLRTLLDEGHRGRVTFLHYARTAADVPFAAELDRIAARHRNVDVLRAHTRAGGGELSGRYAPEHLRGVDPAAAAYVCGPVGLVDAVRETWPGRPPRVEFFKPPAPAPEAGGPTGEIRFTATGRGVPNTGRTLLEQAEAAGLTPAFGCRMGICHSCVRRKSAGHVRDVLTGELSREADEDVRICVSAPVGDVHIDL